MAKYFLVGNSIDSAVAANEAIGSLSIPSAYCSKMHVSLLRMIGPPWRQWLMRRQAADVRVERTVVK
jgi:hypothetical protein